MLVQLTNALDPHKGESVSVNPESVFAVRRGGAEWAEFTLVEAGNRYANRYCGHAVMLVVQESPGIVHEKLTAAMGKAD